MFHFSHSLIWATLPPHVHEYTSGGRWWGQLREHFSFPEQIISNLIGSALKSVSFTEVTVPGQQ